MTEQTPTTEQATDESQETTRSRFISRIANKIKGGVARVVTGVKKFFAPLENETASQTAGRRTRTAARRFRQISFTFAGMLVTTLGLVLFTAMTIIEVALRLVGFVLASPLYLKGKRFKNEFKLVFTGSFCWIWISELNRVSDAFYDMPDMFDPLTPNDVFPEQFTDQDVMLDMVIDQLRVVLDDIRSGKGKGRPTPKQVKSTTGRTQSQAHRDAQRMAAESAESNK